MGEIADDCFNRAMDELEMLDMDPDYFSGGGGYPFYGRIVSAPRRVARPAAQLSDFDDLDDFSDLL